MSDELLDLAEFKERVQDDIELLLELLDIYSSDFEEKRKLLQEAVETKNYDQIKSIAHSIKGASGNISAKTMRECFVKLEEMGKTGDISGAPELLVRVDQIYGDLSKRFDQLKIELKK